MPNDFRAAFVVRSKGGHALRLLNPLDLKPLIRLKRYLLKCSEAENTNTYREKRLSVWVKRFLT